MADRRMIHRKVIESDAFYSLSEAAQALYLHLTINADDDGFINCAESCASRIKGGKQALKELVKFRFLLQFGNIYVIKHWRIGNSLRNDRSKLPVYPSIAMQVWVKANRSYTDHSVPGCVTLYEAKTGIQPGIQNGIQNGNPDGIQNGSLTEQNRTELNRTELNRSIEQGFEQLWTSYPEVRRGSKSVAAEAYRRSVTSERDIKAVQVALNKWKRSEQWSRDGGQYIPSLHNWLDRETWKSDPPKMAVPRGASGELGEAELEAIRRILAEEIPDLGDDDLC